MFCNYVNYFHAICHLFITCIKIIIIIKITIFFLYIFWISCWSVIHPYGNEKKTCLFNFCIIHTWRIKSRKKCTADLYIVNLFWNYLIFFYMTSVYPNKWPFRMHFNIFNDWIRRSVYIWPNYSIHWLLEDSLIIIPSFVLLSKLSVMNELWFQGL